MLSFENREAAEGYLQEFSNSLSAPPPLPDGMMLFFHNFPFLTFFLLSEYNERRGSGIFSTMHDESDYNPDYEFIGDDEDASLHTYSSNANTGTDALNSAIQNLKNDELDSSSSDNSVYIIQSKNASSDSRSDAKTVDAKTIDAKTTERKNSVDNTHKNLTDSQSKARKNSVENQKGRKDSSSSDESSRAKNLLSSTEADFNSELRSKVKSRHFSHENVHEASTTTATTQTTTPLSKKSQSGSAEHRDDAKTPSRGGSLRKSEQSDVTMNENVNNDSSPFPGIALRDTDLRTHPRILEIQRKQQEYEEKKLKLQREREDIEADRIIDEIFDESSVEEDYGKLMESLASSDGGDENKDGKKRTFLKISKTKNLCLN